MRFRAALVALLALLLPLLVASPARAELFHPRQQWLRDSTAGLFLHWGMRTKPGYTDCAEWEKAVTDGGWTPEYWVREAQKLHASYLVLTSFHSRLGYARSWPSKIPGSCTTKRDFLGELIAAAHASKLRVTLYMTDDPQWWWEGLPQGQSWFDSAAYSAYKGKQVDLHTRPGFGEYSYDNFVEVMQNYPALDGFWIDNDNAYWEQNGLYERIRAERPHMLLSNNNEDTPIMDTMSNEQKTGMSPPYDYPAAVLTPMPRLTEACFKLPSKGAWWYDGQDSAIDWPLSIGRYVTNTGASVKNLIAETAMVNGRFPPKQEEFNDFMQGYLDGIWESLSGVEGGGYMYGGLQPGAWNDGAHGTVTVRKNDPGTQYIHVVTKPTGDQLRIRDNGYLAGWITDLRTGRPLRFHQRDGWLTIDGITTWDTYDTVFKVTTLTRLGANPEGWLTATASASRDGQPAANLTDDDFLTYWDSDTTVPVSITLEQQAPLPVKYLAINQREWSPTYNRTSFGRPEDSARIKDYRVFTSQDGVTWGEPVKTGVLESARGVRFIDLDLPSTRFVKLQVDSTWAAPTAPNFLNKLRIDEIHLGYLTPRR